MTHSAPACSECGSNMVLDKIAVTCDICRPGDTPVGKPGDRGWLELPPTEIDPEELAVLRYGWMRRGRLMVCPACI